MLLTPNPLFQNRFGLESIQLIDKENCLLTLNNSEGARLLGVSIKVTITNSKIETASDSPKRINVKLNINTSNKALTLTGDLQEILKCLKAASLADENELRNAQQEFCRRTRP